MPADPNDIGPAIRPAAVATWEGTAIKARYPNARDGQSEPGEGFFDSIADAQAIVNARGVLIGVERRRFAAQIDGLAWLDPSTGVPTVTLIDAEQAANGPFLVSRIELDLEAERTSLELFG
jgi:hypothetical protein